MNISAVARRHGIKPALVYQWKKELGAPPTSDSALVPVIVPPSPVESPPAQASQAGPSGSCAIEIMLANGRRLKVSAGIAPTTLKQLIAALEA